MKGATSGQRARWNEILVAAAGRRAVIRELSREERPRAFAGCAGDGYTYLVHRDTHPANLGGWRVTYLMPCKPFPEYQGPAELTPIGHVCAEGYVDALLEADSLGADLSREVPL
jgi:hypothetical protein